MPRQWTEEQRAAQAERCWANQPWKRSTGPRTKAGKNKVRYNARKPASWDMWIQLWLAGESAAVRLVSKRLNRRAKAKARDKAARRS